jgi:FkbM family methyltransferase
VTERNLLSASNGFNRCILGREGYIVYNKNDIYGGAGIERYGEDAESELRVLRQLCSPGAVVVEVGANIGSRTMVLARQVAPAGFVYAYEPQRIVFQTLCANLALNSIVNVDARHAAVGAEQGWVHEPDLDYGKRANFGAVGVSPAGQDKSRRVRQVRIDEDLQLSRLNLMKIDVEGMELEVLTGADALIRRFRPALYVENDRLERSEALIHHLLKLEYRLYWHKPPMFNPTNYFGDPENIFPNLVSFNMLCLPCELGQHVQGMEEVKDAAEHPLRRGC